MKLNKSRKNINYNRNKSIFKYKRKKVKKNKLTRKRNYKTKHIAGNPFNCKTDFLVYIICDHWPCNSSNGRCKLPVVIKNFVRDVFNELDKEFGEDFVIISSEKEFTVKQALTIKEVLLTKLLHHKPYLVEYINKELFKNSSELTQEEINSQKRYIKIIDIIITDLQTGNLFLDELLSIVEQVKSTKIEQNGELETIVDLLSRIIHSIANNYIYKLIKDILTFTEILALDLELGAWNIGLLSGGPKVLAEHPWVKMIVSPRSHPDSIIKTQLTKFIEEGSGSPPKNKNIRDQLVMQLKKTIQEAENHYLNELDETVIMAKKTLKSLEQLEYNWLTGDLKKEEK